MMTATIPSHSGQYRIVKSVVNKEAVSSSKLRSSTMDSEGQMETNVPVKGVAKGKRIKEN